VRHIIPVEDIHFQLNAVKGNITYIFKGDTEIKHFASASESTGLAVFFDLK